MIHDVPNRQQDKKSAPPHNNGHKRLLFVFISTLAGNPSGVSHVLQPRRFLSFLCGDQFPLPMTKIIPSFRIRSSPTLHVTLNPNSYNQLSLLVFMSLKNFV